MYLQQLQLQHLKRVRELTLDFTHEGRPRLWTVLIGENGTAKTTILQAIALAAAGSKQVNALAVPVVKHLRDRRAEQPMAITADFGFTPASQRRSSLHPLAAGRSAEGLCSEVSLKAGRSTTLDARAYYRDKNVPNAGDPLDEARDVHRPLWFVAGYGIARALPDSTLQPSLDLPSIDRLRPIFDAQARLASSSFANYFLAKDAREGRRAGTTSRLYSRMLNAALKLGGEDLMPGITKLELRGQGGAGHAHSLIESDRFEQRMGTGKHKIAGVALSHGFQSTFAWIADLIGHVLLEAEVELSTTEMEGLVLIDEIDLYLHPLWQAQFVQALRRVFPLMQFIATTHSPIVLAGLAPHEIVRLIVDPNTGDVTRGDWAAGELGPSTVPEPDQPDPRAMTATEIYRTWFGLDRLTPNPAGEMLRRYRVLEDDPAPTPKDKQERARLKSLLISAGVLPPDTRPRGPARR